MPVESKAENMTPMPGKDGSKSMSEYDLLDIDLLLTGAYLCLVSWACPLAFPYYELPLNPLSPDHNYRKFADIFDFKLAECKLRHLER